MSSSLKHLYAFTSLFGLAIFSFVLSHTSRGMDFSDEGMHLNSISGPWEFSAGASQFGFVYFPIYSLVGGDIFSLRLISISIIFALSLIVSILVFNEFLGLATSNASKFAMSVGLASVVLIFFANWLPTPSYYSLALKGGLLVSIGLMASRNKGLGARSIGWILLTAGVWFVFLARPTSGLILGLFVLTYLVVSKLLTKEAVIIGAISGTGLVVMTVLYVDGSPVEWVNRLYLGAKQSGLQDTKYTFWGLFRFDLFLPSLVDFVVALILSLALFLANRQKLEELAIQKPIAYTLFLLTFMVTAILVPQALHPGRIGLFYPTMALAIIFTFLILNRTHLGELAQKSNLETWPLPVLLGLVPFALSFGSNVNHWKNSSLTGFFWLLGAVALVLGAIKVSEQLIRSTLVLIILIQTLALIGLISAVESPYRQTARLADQNVSTEVGPEAAKLFLAVDVNAYVLSGQKLLLDSGFRKGDFMLDLTGQSPGYLFAVGAKSVALPWVIGGYQGSDALARDALSRFECDPDSGFWLIVEPTGPRAIQSEILAVKGFDLSKDFTLVGGLSTPQGLGGYDYERIQEFFKPNLESGIFTENCQ